MLVITLLLGGAILLLALLWYLYDQTKHWERRGIPHVPGLPLFGNFLPLVLRKKNVIQITEEIYAKFPDAPVVGFYDFITPRLMVRDPEVIKEVLMKNFDSFANRGSIQIDTKKNPMDDQLFFMTGARWKAFRTKLSPIFTSGRLKEVFATMTSIGSNLIDYIEERKDKEIEVREAAGLFSMDIIGSAVFGIDPATLKNPNCEFREKGLKLINPDIVTKIKFALFILAPNLFAKLGFSFQDSRVHPYFNGIIKKALDVRREKQFRRNDMIQWMMELKEKGQVDVRQWDANDDYLKTGFTGVESYKFEITDEVLMAQANSFMVAGFEATALVMAFSLVDVSQNPEVMAKLKDEISQQIKAHGSLNYEALRNMRYLEAVIKETQRMHHIVPSLLRGCTKSCTLSDGTYVEKGEDLTIPVVAIHKDPKNYEDPLSFKPERFLEPVNPAIFLPFGEGPRICIAMRYAQLVIKYGLALLIHNYKIKLSPKTELPIDLNSLFFGSKKILLIMESENNTTD